jgi:hypothetical protein
MALSLKRKSDFYRVFFNFQAMVEKQFQREIQVFHSDSGGEFTKQEFIDHLLSTGIVHLLSCPGTPEQNSVAERKHRHVVELGLAMLLHASAPKYFGLRLFSLLLSLLIACPLPPLACTHLIFFFIRKSLHMIFFALLVVSVFRISVPMPKINLSQDLYPAFLLVTVINIKGIVVFTYPLEGLHVSSCGV